MRNIASTARADVAKPRPMMDGAMRGDDSPTNHAVALADGANAPDVLHCEAKDFERRASARADDIAGVGAAWCAAQSGGAREVFGAMPCLCTLPLLVLYTLDLSGSIRLNSAKV